MGSQDQATRPSPADPQTVGYHRSLELCGGHNTRLEEPWVKESLDRYGVVIVEGMNDALRMEYLHVAAVGLGSNNVTTEQLDKPTRFARQLANNRIFLMPECNEERESGFKELLWKLCEAQVNESLGWSSKTYASRQPESLAKNQWQMFVASVDGIALRSLGTGHEFTSYLLPDLSL